MKYNNILMRQKLVMVYKKDNKNGFTVVELLVVIVVIGILAVTTIVSYTGVSQKAISSTLKSDLVNAATRLGLDNALNGTYPTTESSANDGKGLPKSPGTIYKYNQSGNSYCISAYSSSNSSVYHIASSKGTIEDGFCTISQTSLATNLVAYWQFDESSGNAIDSVNSLSAVNYNSVPYSSGFEGNSTVYNGTNMYFRATLAISSGVGSADTFAIWIYQNAAQPAKNGAMASGYQIHMWVNADRTINYGNWTNITNEEYKSTGTIIDNQWNLVVVTSVSALETKCYINGVLAGQHSLTGNIGNAGYIEFGRHPNHDLSHFIGKLDNAGYWNRALSASEVALLYNSGIGLRYQ